MLSISVLRRIGGTAIATTLAFGTTLALGPGAVALTFGMALALGPGAAAAAPYHPASDAEKLEQLPLRPAAPEARELSSLRAALALDPNDIGAAVRLSRRYIELGRQSGDPRYDGYAQAAIAPWWKLEEPPQPVLVLRATLRQHIHQFDAALGDLAVALRRDPRDVQSRLTRATVLQVRGEWDAARRDCQALTGLTLELVTAACTAGVDSLHGRLQSSYAALSGVLARHPEAPPAIREWVLSQLAEMAERLGRAEDARRLYDAAIAADPQDPYVIGTYADFFLDHHQPERAAELTREHTRNDALLLRYALAHKAMGAADAAGLVQELRDRFAASRLRGDRVHLREEARFRLELDGDAESALGLAQENWAVQKEPADAGIFLQAAAAAHATDAGDAVRNWLSGRGYEDARFAVTAPRRVAVSQ